jgi:hypothetical protein
LQWVKSKWKEKTCDDDDDDDDGYIFHGWLSIFLHLPMNDHHFTYKEKNLKMNIGHDECIILNYTIQNHQGVGNYDNSE